MLNLEVDSLKKVFNVTAKGVLSFQEMTDYLSKLKDAIKKVDPMGYALIIDAREQKTFAPEAVPLLDEALKLYTETPFCKRFSVVLESAIAMLQVKKVGKENVDQFVMVRSVEEAYKMI